VRAPHELYELTRDPPRLDEPVMIQALGGFVDAGSAVRLARDHLLSVGDPQVLVSFDLDQLLDYRSRRPTMMFMADHWESYDEQALTVRLLRDDAGTSYLMLAGPEPDLQWDRFIAAVTGLCQRFGVRLTVGLNAIPMAVPHTRPVGVTAHATRPELIDGYEPWLQRVQVPASAGNLLEFRLGQRGHDALGFAAHVPHYLAQGEYPAASEALLLSACRVTGLSLPTDALREAADKLRAGVDGQVAKSTEVATHVRGLEEQYDLLMRTRQSPAPDFSSLPTADELGAELERFLAEQTRPDNPPSAG
jgi:hypothetical protein